jgi:hypothetical protein
MAIQRGFDYDIEWKEEASYGAGITGVDTCKTVSNVINGVTLMGNNNAECIFSIGDVAAADTVTGVEEYTLTVDYLLQDSESSTYSLLYYGTHRNSDNDLDSVAFSLQIGDKYYELTGGICNSVQLQMEEGGHIRVTQEFYLDDVDDPVTSFVGGTHASAFTGPLASYGGCSFQKAGAALAEGTRSFSVTINNNAERLYSIGSDVASKITAGLVNISGTADVHIDADADTVWGWMTGATEGDIVIDTGSVTYPATITLNTSVFGSVSLDLNNKDGHLVSGLPFIAEDITLA